MSEYPPPPQGPPHPPPPPPQGPPPHGPPGPYGQPHWQQGPPPKKKKKRTGLIIGIVAGALALLCLCGVIVIAVSSSDEAGDDPVTESPAPAPDQEEEPEAPDEEALPGIGAPVRDGKFEFVVKSVRCGVERVGNDILNATAQGQFCLVTMSVRNIGDEAQLFDSSSQKAKNASGQTYSADGTASLYANEDNQAFLNEINPGNEVASAVIVFDIPKGQKLALLELHDSPFSGGVEVSLG